jgi:hypothetical protein
LTRRQVTQQELNTIGEQVMSIPWQCPVFVSLIVCGLANAAAAEEAATEGKIQLQRYEFGGDASKKAVIKAGKQVTFEVNAYIDKFFDDVIINANAKIVNKTSMPQRAIYVITFYDAQGNVVGAHATTWRLDANKEVNYGSGLIKGKEADFKRVTRYKLYTCSFETTASDK